jgi:hypothetical protein
MHLQLVGRLDPNETYAIFNIENVTNIITGNWVNLEILNVIICQDQDHSHFESTEKASYPVNPARYKEKILLSIPKPRQVTFRRRTFLMTDQVTLPSEQPPRRRQKRNVNLDALQMQYSAIFKSTILRFDIVDFPNASIARIIERLQQEQRPRVINHFQKLLKGAPSYELVVAEPNRRSKKVKITLPPLTRLMCSSKYMFSLLGLESQIDVTTFQKTQYFSLNNTSRMAEKIFLSDHVVDAAMKFTVLFESEACPSEFRWSFMRYPDVLAPTLVNFEEDALCRQNPRATEAFLRLTLLSIQKNMALPSGCFTTGLTDNYIEIKKTVEFYNQYDHINNFHLVIRLGEKLQELLGFEENLITWSMGKRDQRYKLIMADPPETPQEIELCLKKTNEVLVQNFSNQQGPGQFVANLQNKWQEYVAQRRQQQQQATEAQPETSGAPDPPDDSQPEAPAEDPSPDTSSADDPPPPPPPDVPSSPPPSPPPPPPPETPKPTSKRELQQAIAEEEATQELLFVLQDRENERRAHFKQTNLELIEEETTEIDRLEERASASARAGNEAESHQLVEDWKQLKVEIEERRKNRLIEEDEKIALFQDRLHKTQVLVTESIKKRQLIERKIEAERRGEAVDDDADADDDDESTRGRQQLLDDLLEEEEKRLHEDAEDEVESGDEFLQIEIDNPKPRPPTTFNVASNVTKHICTVPEVFPDYCTVIVKEGEPDDYVSSRGPCSVLGIIRKNVPNIVSNKKCIVKRFQTLKYISLEFVDESLNTFKIAPNVNPMWIKLDVSCTTYF